MWGTFMEYGYFIRAETKSQLANNSSAKKNAYHKKQQYSINIHLNFVFAIRAEQKLLNFMYAVTAKYKYVSQKTA